jgi:hypothetical protein
MLCCYCAGGAGCTQSYADYEAIRAHALGQSTNGSLPLVVNAFVSPAGDAASVVVFNPSDTLATFKLRDYGPGVDGARAAKASIPAHAIQTYTYSVP